jgi:hypothetical protein
MKFVLAAVAIMISPRTAAQECGYTACPAGLSFRYITPAKGGQGSLLTSITDLIDGTQIVDLPFTFNWMKNSPKNQVVVSTNGHINLDTSINSTEWLVDPIGTVNHPRISVGDGDFNLGTSGSGDVGIYSTTSETGVVESFIISYEDAEFYYFDGLFNGQAELFPNGDVNICYGNGETPTNVRFAAGIEDPSVGAFPLEGFPFDDQGVVVNSPNWPGPACFCFACSENPSSTPSSSINPSSEPSESPSQLPSGRPSGSPSSTPSSTPSSSINPSSEPSESPSQSPSGRPSGSPSQSPSVRPSGSPSQSPTLSAAPSVSSWPSSLPSCLPSDEPSGFPSESQVPTNVPTNEPSAFPTVSPVPSNTPSVSNAPTKAKSAKKSKSKVPKNLRPKKSKTKAPKNLRPKKSKSKAPKNLRGLKSKKAKKAANKC